MYVWADIFVKSEEWLSSSAYFHCWLNKYSECLSFLRFNKTYCAHLLSITRLRTKRTGTDRAWKLQLTKFRFKASRYCLYRGFFQRCTDVYVIQIHHSTTIFHTLTLTSHSWASSSLKRDVSSHYWKHIRVSIELSWRQAKSFGWINWLRLEFLRYVITLITLSSQNSNENRQSIIFKWKYK